MKLLAVAVLAMGCGKSETGSAPASAPAPASGSAPASAPAPAPASGSAPAPASASPTLPDNARCTGHWIATMNFNSTKTCDDATLAPFLELDAVVDAGPSGWTASVTKPAGMTVTDVTATWSSGTSPSCSTKIHLSKDDLQLTIELSRGFGAPKASPNVSRSHGDVHCMGNGIGADAKLTEGSKNLPPIAPKLRDVSGAYQLELKWPKKYKCKKVHPPATQTFTITVDRKNGDVLDAPGLEGPFSLAEVRLNEPGEVYLRTSHDELEVVGILHVTKTDVTGEATFQFSAGGPDDKPPCNSAKATVKGTRTPP